MSGGFDGGLIKKERTSSAVSARLHNAISEELVVDILEDAVADPPSPPMVETPPLPCDLPG